MAEHSRFYQCYTLTVQSTFKTKKSSCVTARGVPPAVYRVHSMLCPGGGEEVGGTPVLVLLGGGGGQGHSCGGPD